jgi:AcrR family transcriptional regulator
MTEWLWYVEVVGVRVPNSQTGSTVAKPLLSVEAIYDEALRVLATDGAAGLNARNLSSRLRCSTKTLYQQVGNRDALVRGVVARAFGSIDIDFSTDMDWQDSVRTWCHALRSALTARPDLCSLMTTADRGVVIGYVTQLIRVLTRHGFSHDDAIRACGILVHVTLSMTLADMAAPGQWDDPAVFDTTVRWLIDGMEAAAGG